MLTPHEFKRTRAARPRPDLGGDDLADLGTTCWCVGRISTDKHLSIGNAHAVLPKKLVCTGRQWSARVGRRPWRCRCGLPYWWPPVLADAVAVRRGGVRPCGWCTGWRSLPLVSVRRAGGRSVAGVRPWPWWPFSWPLAAFRPSAGPMVRRGPFVARGGPFSGLASGAPWWRPLALCACLVRWQCSAAACARRRWCAVLVLACLVAPSVVAVAVSLAVLAGVAGVGVIAPCRGPWSVSLAASMGRRVVVCWWCHCAVPCWAVCRFRPSVLVSAVAVAGRVRPSLLVCWCAVGGWRPFLAVFRGRGGPFGPSVGVGVRRWSLRPVWALFWALPTGWPCGPCQWLAAVAGGACACGGACLVKERRPVAGWRWAVCGAFRGGGVRLPCLWSLLVSHQRRPWAVRLSKDQTPAAAVAALLVVWVTCSRWRRRRWRRWSRPCASRPTCGGQTSAYRRRRIPARKRTGWR